MLFLFLNSAQNAAFYFNQTPAEEADNMSVSGGSVTGPSNDQVVKNENRRFSALQSTTKPFATATGSGLNASGAAKTSPFSSIANEALAAKRTEKTK